MQGKLCLADVWSQVILAVAMHWLLDGKWTMHDLGARIAVAVPVALTCLYVWRVTTGNAGWIRTG